MDQVARTSQNIPRVLTVPANRLLYTYQLHLGEAGLARHSLRRPTHVNLIRMELPHNDIITAYRASSLSNRVCSEFDITLCSVALADVTADLQFKESAFFSYNGAFEALADRKIILHTTAFSCQHALVDWQMNRVSKYLARQFRW